MKDLIAFCGGKYNGKDTAAEVLLDRGYAKLSIASPFKKMIAAWLRSTGDRASVVKAMLNSLLSDQGVSGYDRTALLGETGRNYETIYLGGRTPVEASDSLIEWGQTYVGGDFWNDQGLAPGLSEDTIHEMLEGYLKESSEAVINGKTPRHVMQTIGVEWGRNCLADNFWIDVAMRRAQFMPKCVMTDIRFDAEAEAVNAAGGMVIKIIREGLPPSNDTHSTEQGVSDHLLAARIYNNSSVEVLQTYVLKKIGELKLKVAA